MSLASFLSPLLQLRRHSHSPTEFLPRLLAGSLTLKHSTEPHKLSFGIWVKVSMAHNIYIMFVEAHNMPTQTSHADDIKFCRQLEQ